LEVTYASLAYWGGALQDPNRLGPNGGTSNQSIRGFLIRLGPSGALGAVIWVVLAVAVLWFGFVIAREAERRGQIALQVGTIGLVAVLVSPVSWIHHLAWLAVVIPALLGDGRDRVRWGFAVVLTGWFLCRLPWWGVTWRARHTTTEFFGRAMQIADTVGAVLALVFIWLALQRVPLPKVALDGQVQAGRLEGRDGGQEQTEDAADPADRRQTHPAQ
jgi:alpha-1,2-mannosyltransferase